MAEKKITIRELIETGKRNGKLTTKEINDAIEETGFDVEQIDKLYETLERNSVEIVDEPDQEADAFTLTEASVDMFESALSAEGVAIDDPVLMMNMPASLTAATGMDALTHAIEAYVSTAATPMTDACAEKAMEYINRYLRRSVACGAKDKEAREGMCYAQYLAGMAFNNASLGHVHAMAHQLGGFYDLPHGECNAILLPHVCEYNLIACRRRFGRVAKLLGERVDHLSASDASHRAIEAINTLSRDVNIPEGLIALGKKYGKEVREEDIPTMTANAQKDACGLTNPRIMTDAAVAAIYKAAL